LHVLEIKYDGPSFDGVMNIQDLGNELLGIEYCLTKIINDLVRIDKELSEADIESLQILTEGFVNNCFKKKLKFFLSNLSENLANTPILRSTLKAAIDTYLHTQSVQTSLSRGDTKSMLKSGLAMMTLNCHYHFLMVLLFLLILLCIFYQ
jgi:hypothetical protein